MQTHSYLHRHHTLDGEDAGRIHIIATGRILHILESGLNQAIGCDRETIRTFQNHFTVMCRMFFRQRIAIRLAHGETDSQEVAVGFLQPRHHLQRLLENHPGRGLDFRTADIANFRTAPSGTSK